MFEHYVCMGKCGRSETWEKNCGNVRQEQRKERQSWSTAPKLKSHVPTVWLPTATRHDVTGSWSWSWTWGWGGRAGHCQGLRGEDGIVRGRSTAYRGRVTWPEWLLGWSPGRAGVFAWPARVNQNKSYPPPLLTEPLSQSVSRIWLRESFVKPIRSNNPSSRYRHSHISNAQALFHFTPQYEGFQ